MRDDTLWQLWQFRRPDRGISPPVEHRLRSLLCSELERVRTNWPNLFSGRSKTQELQMSRFARWESLSLQAAETQHRLFVHLRTVHQHFPDTHNHAWEAPREPDLGHRPRPQPRIVQPDPRGYRWEVQAGRAVQYGTVPSVCRPPPFCTDIGTVPMRLAKHVQRIVVTHRYRFRCLPRSRFKYASVPVLERRQSENKAATTFSILERLHDLQHTQ